jgi:hypothetical protein
MYINTKTLEWPVSEGDIRAVHPNVSFPTPFVPPEEYAYVFPTPIPAFDTDKQRAVQVQPELSEKGAWSQCWGVLDLSDEDLDRLAAIKAQQHRSAALTRINALELQQTARMQREALLGGDYALQKLTELEAEIDALRAELK